ncbi:uncharacterized protein MONBRDRAFT_4878 [Monosiga brevicollis MX1]|uniref:Uncharacterized protein n=1 Tax=Monosiga brevicollis TaxID=81824 RepID=A9UP75_MONBE|nr:uncharacterized protein MONBRDRAFT_4878 [Monosiga brevicollis MX1]EDQ92372.1 predicted protein [Monosiga brevicollis MX1]|eukprot:XP_001742134.1 hypothetical protein [Monosiga brevicollis MX1]
MATNSPVMRGLPFANIPRHADVTQTPSIYTYPFPESQTSASYDRLQREAGGYQTQYTATHRAAEAAELAMIERLQASLTAADIRRDMRSQAPPPAPAAPPPSDPQSATQAADSSLAQLDAYLHQHFGTQHSADLHQAATAPKSQSHQDATRRGAPGGQPSHFAAASRTSDGVPRVVWNGSHFVLEEHGHSVVNPISSHVPQAPTTAASHVRMAHSNSTYTSDSVADSNPLVTWSDQGELQVNALEPDVAAVDESISPSTAPATASHKQPPRPRVAPKGRPASFCDMATSPVAAPISGTTVLPAATQSTAFISAETTSSSSAHAGSESMQGEAAPTSNNPGPTGPRPLARQSLPSAEASLDVPEASARLHSHATGTQTAVTGTTGLDARAKVRDNDALSMDSLMGASEAPADLEDPASRSQPLRSSDAKPKAPAKQGPAGATSSNPSDLRVSVQELQALAADVRALQGELRRLHERYESLSVTVADQQAQTAALARAQDQAARFQSSRRASADASGRHADRNAKSTVMSHVGSNTSAPRHACCSRGTDTADAMSVDQETLAAGQEEHHPSPSPIAPPKAVSMSETSQHPRPNRSTPNRNRVAFKEQRQGQRIGRGPVPQPRTTERKVKGARGLSNGAGSAMPQPRYLAPTKAWTSHVLAGRADRASRGLATDGLAHVQVDLPFNGVPFVAGTSTAPSQSLGGNLQQVFALLKRQGHPVQLRAETEAHGEPLSEQAHRELIYKNRRLLQEAREAQMQMRTTELSWDVV